MNKRLLSLAALLSSLSINAFSESLSDYISQCKSELQLSSIPAVSCTTGTYIKGNDGLVIPTRENYLGKVNTGNPAVDAVFLCRSVSTNKQNAGLIGYILQNRNNGNTCFFDAVGGGSATPGSPETSPQNWQQPIGLQSIATGNCHTCHVGDPYIATPGLSKAFKAEGLMVSGRNFFDYNVVSSADSSSVFNGWQAERDQLVDDTSSPSATCSAACHQVAKSNPGTLARVNDLTSPFMPPKAKSAYLFDPPPASSPTVINDTIVLAKETFDNRFTWRQSKQDTDQFTLAEFDTPSVGTGPIKDSGRGASQFAFLETSSGSAFSNEDHAILESPLFNGMNAKLTFEYHMYGENTGTLYVDVYDGSWRNNVLSYTGQQQLNQKDAFKKSSLSLDQYGAEIKIRFRAVAVGGYKGDIAIDNIYITKPTPEALPTWSTVCKFNNPDTTLGCEEHMSFRYPIDEGEIYKDGKFLTFITKTYSDDFSECDIKLGDPSYYVVYNAFDPNCGYTIKKS